MKALFSSRKQHFFLRRIRGILTIRRRACVSLRRSISGSWACDTLVLEIEDRPLGDSLFRVMKMQHISPYYCAPLIRRIICRSAVRIAPEGRGWGVTDDTMCLHQVISHSASLLPISGKPLVVVGRFTDLRYLCGYK